MLSFTTEDYLGFAGIAMFVAGLILSLMAEKVRVQRNFPRPDVWQGVLGVWLLRVGGLWVTAVYLFGLFSQ